MKQHLTLLLAILLTACGTAVRDRSGEGIPGHNKDSIAGSQQTESVETNPAEDTTFTEYATFYVVVADTGQDYYLLWKEMFDISLRHHLQIDTMGRYFNASKNLIALPDNDEDELYAGEYFPRRFPSNTLSLEYLSQYQPQAAEKTIALLIGIYETKRESDSALTIIRPTTKKGFSLKAEMFVGCMH